MIIVGIVLLAIALLLPPLGMAADPGLLHAMAVLGVVLIVVGLVLYLGARADRPWGRRYY